MEENEIYERFDSLLDLKSMGFERLIDPTEFYQYMYLKKVDGVYYYLNYNFYISKFRSIGTWLAFEDVELPLKALLEKYGLFKKKREDWDRFQTLSFHKLIPINSEAHQKFMELDKIVMKDEETISLVVEGIKTYINAVFKPLWEQYASLQYINDEIIDKVPQMKLSDYIPGNMPFKKLIIMRLCGNPNYNKYIEWAIGIYKANLDKGLVEYKNDFEIFMELVNMEIPPSLAQGVS